MQARRVGDISCYQCHTISGPEVMTLNPTLRNREKHSSDIVSRLPPVYITPYLVVQPPSLARILLRLYIVHLATA